MSKWIYEATIKQETNSELTCALCDYSLHVEQIEYCGFGGDDAEVLINDIKDHVRNNTRHHQCPFKFKSIDGGKSCVAKNVMA